MTEKERKKVRIGIFTYDFLPWEGGMGRHVSEITTLLSNESYVEILIFSPCRNNIENHTPLFTFTKKMGKNVLFSLLLNVLLRRIIEKYHLDILHFHTGSGGLFLFRRTEKKVIVTTHTNTYLYQFRLSRRIIKLLLFPLEKYTYQIADCIISVSTFIKKNIVDDYSISPEKIRSIPNGVHTVTFNENTSIDKLNKTILFTGRIDRNKGLEFLIDSLELLYPEHRELQLLIAGEGGYEKAIRVFLKGKKIAPGVHFLGWKNDRELVQLYNQATLYVLPSMSEGFGLTIIEAMACGCPVLATDSGGAGDIIRNGENGYLVKHGDIAQLSALIGELFADPGKREQFGKKGKETIRTEFDWNTIAAKYLGLYTSPI